MSRSPRARLRRVRLFTLAKYGDVKELFCDLDRWSGEFGQSPLYVREGGLRSDPPEHTVYRKLITRAFSARRVASLEPFVRQTATALLDDVVHRGTADLVAAYSGPIPVLVTAHLLGVPAERHAEFRRWSDDFIAAQDTADPAAQQKARDVIDGYFRSELAERRALVAREGPEALPDDLVSVLASAERDGRPFTIEELLPLLLLLLVGGIDTTRSLIGNLVQRLLTLDLWEVCTQPELLDAAIEESLRLDPPVLGLFRTARGEQVVRDVRIPDGAKVQGLYVSANRDPEVFDDPDTFRIDRPREELRRHLSFGAGGTLCPGAALARMEARVALEQLHDRLPGLHLAGTAENRGSFMVGGPVRIPIAWRTQPAGTEV